MKIKFIRNVAVYAIHREQGSVHDIKDQDAVQLIQDGAAVIAKPEIETATAKQPKENAAKR